MKPDTSLISKINRTFIEAFTVLYDSVRGKQHDHTQGSLRKGIFILAIPMVLEMGMESLFAVVDIFFVSKLGFDAVTVVGITEAVITLIYAVAIGFSMAVTAMIARRVGAKEFNIGALTAGQALIAACILSVIIAAIGFTWSEDILRLMGASEDVVLLGSDYTTIMLGFSSSVIFLFISAAIFRGAGNAVIAMRALWIANGINIALDPCLIYGWGPFPELGVTGAAVATNIGRSIGCLYMFYMLFFAKHSVQLSLACLKPNFNIIATLIRISVGGIGQFLIATASWVFLMRIVAEFGSTHVAGYTIAIRIVMFTFLPAWGLSNAAATLVGQNLGAGKPTRAASAAWATARYNMVFLGSIAVLLFVFATPLSQFFSNDPTVISISQLSLKIISIGYVFFALGMVLTQAFNGAGDTRTPTWINFICFWLFQIPLAWILAHPLDMKTTGVIISVMLAEVLLAAIAWVQFKKEKWMLTKV